MQISRRDMLVGLLGLPVVANCRRQTDQISWDGGFIETNAASGHKLRDGFSPKPNKVVEVSCVILGGGISGLSAAWKLSRLGYRDYRILELGGQVGGTSIGGRTDGLRYPWGAHYLPTPQREHLPLLELLEETGSLLGRSETGEPQFAETHLCASPAERVYFAGLWHEGLFPTMGASDHDLKQRHRFFARTQEWAKWTDSDGRRAFALPMQDSSENEKLKRLDDMSMLEWMKRNQFDSPRLRWFVEYACRDDFGGELATTSAWAGLHYFVSRLPASGGSSSEFLTWPEGNEFFVDHMARRVGVDRTELNTLVLSVAPHGDGRRANVTTWNAKTKQATSWISEKVIFAMPSFTRKYVLRGFEKLTEYHPEYAPWLVANIHLKSFPRSHGYPLAWDNVIYGSRSLGYVVSTHQIPRYRGETIWTYYLPLSGSDTRKSRRDLYSLDYKQACDAIVTELSRCHLGFKKNIQRIDIMRWGHAMARPRIGNVWANDRKIAANPLGPIHFAHTDLSSFALFEEAFAHGIRAAKEVARSLRQ